MPRRLLRGSLRCPRDTVGRSPLVRECGAAGLPAPNASHRRVQPAIPQNKIFRGAHNSNSLLARLAIVCLLMFGAGLAASPAVAAEAAKKTGAWGVTELMHSLAQVKESRATFVERKYMSMLKTPLEFSGTLSYIAPAYLEKITLQPKPESMVLDREKLVVRTGAAQQKRTLSLQDYPAIWAFVESIRSTLAGDLDTLNRFYQVTLEGYPKQWLLVLRPLDPKMKSLVSEIRISGSVEQLDIIEIRETGGDYSVMKISKDDS